MSKDDVLFNEKLETAYHTMAVLIRDHGEKYLPIFKRLHEEMEQMKAKQNLQNIALQLAKTMR